MGDSNDELQPGPTEFFGMVGRMRPPERYDKIQNILLFVGLGADVAQHGFFQIWAGGLCHGLAAPPSAGGRRCYPLLACSFMSNGLVQYVVPKPWPIVPMRILMLSVQPEPRSTRAMGSDIRSKSDEQFSRCLHAWH